LFIGGLFDGLFTVPYTSPLTAALPSTWRFVQPLLSSSYLGWGSSSLGQDVKEIVECINYILSIRPHGKIVMMGHSTGCQDIMHYLLSPNSENKPVRPHLAGGILQAGASDRECLKMILPEGIYESSAKIAEDYVAAGRGEDVLPRHVLGGAMDPVPICARRWLSLLSPAPNHDGEDDYFSSDFEDERLKDTFGQIGSTGTPIQILFSEKDQYVPEYINKEDLVGRWTRFIRDGGGIVDEASGIVKGADHTLASAGEDVVGDLVARVTAFLGRVEMST
jgi:pimeloyl-ACP methyl ester carboxylesterase